MNEYILSVIITALVCGFIPSLLTEGTPRELTKMACGLVLVLAVVGPSRDFDIEIWEDALSWPEDGGVFISQGEDLAQKAMADIIKADSEAYILDKAAELGAGVQARVSLNGVTPPLPTAVTIEGSVSPAVREQLQQLICTQLGIAKENLTWTGET